MGYLFELLTTFESTGAQCKVPTHVRYGFKLHSEGLVKTALAAAAPSQGQRLAWSDFPFRPGHHPSSRHHGPAAVRHRRQNPHRLVVATTSTPEQNQVHEETLDEPHEETHEQQHRDHEDTHESSAKPVKRSMKAEDDQEPVAHTAEDEARQVSLPMATQLPSRESQSRSEIAAIDAARLRVASGRQQPPRCPSARRTTQGRAGLQASLERKNGLSQSRLEHSI